MHGIKTMVVSGEYCRPGQCFEANVIITIWVEYVKSWLGIRQQQSPLTQNSRASDCHWDLCIDLCWSSQYEDKGLCDSCSRQGCPQLSSHSTSPLLSSHTNFSFFPFKSPIAPCEQHPQAWLSLCRPACWVPSLLRSCVRTKSSCWMLVNAMFNISMLSGQCFLVSRLSFLGGGVHFIELVLHFLASCFNLTRWIQSPHFSSMKNASNFWEFFKSVFHGAKQEPICFTFQ